MIEKVAATGCAEAVWIIRPTRSMTWRQAKQFIAVVTIISLAIGAWFLYRGFPLVLPFSGLEALAVAAAFYIVLRDGERREVITIAADTVTVEKGRRQAEVQVSFERAWARVFLEQSARRWYPSRLSIASHGRSIELGDFLTNGERQALATALINAIDKNG